MILVVYDILKDNKKNLVAKVLLRELGEKMILSLPFLSIVHAVECNILELVSLKWFIIQRIAKLEFQLDEIIKELDILHRVKITDLEALKNMNAGLTTYEGDYSNTGYEAINDVINYNPFNVHKRVINLELRNAKNVLLQCTGKIQDLEEVRKASNMVNTIVEDLKQLINLLNRQGIPTSYIIDLDSTDLVSLLESGERR